MNGYLYLSLGNLSVTLRRFLGDDLPRKFVEPVKAETSAYGAFISYGRYYEERHEWNLNAIVSHEEAAIIRAIYGEHQLLRRTFQPAHLLIIDTTQPFEERSQTRAIAPAPFNVISPVSNTHVSYYAQYFAWFNAQPTSQQMGSRHDAMQLSFVEYALKVPPA